MKIKTRMQIKKTLMQMVTCTSAVLVISAMPVYGADGWQQDTAQQWFYMEHDDNRIRPLDELLDIYLNTVGANANLILNVPPCREGYFKNLLPRSFSPI